MPFARALLSALTLFGGHFANRRADRVRLVGAALGVILLMLGGVVAAALFGNSFRSPGIALLMFGVPFVLMICLVVGSAIVTYRDAGARAATPLSQGMRLVAAALSLLGLFCTVSTLLIGGTSLFFAYRLLTADTSEPFDPVHYGVHYGGGIRYEDSSVPSIGEPDGREPPAGRERLRGRVTLDGAGVGGLKLHVVLNDRYEVWDLETDERGMFELRVPAGTWFVNSIDVYQWDRRPRDRSLWLFSGHEPKHEDNWYVNIGDLDSKGYPVVLPSPRDAIPIELEFRDTVAVTWPPRIAPPGSGGGREVARSTLPESTIAWRPVAGATEYEVHITHTIRSANSISSNGVLRRVLAGTSLPLSSLPQRHKPPEAPADEYEVEVYAFDAAGSLLTQSGAGYELAFQLVGAERLGKEEFLTSGSSHPVVISEEYEANEALLTRVEESLERKQFATARETLDKITRDAPPGRALALRGKLAALEGDCRSALRLFDAAEKEGTCAPLEDRQLCSAPDSSAR